MMIVRQVEPQDYEDVLNLLRKDFYTEEPCAVGINLCPLGYRIPALEADIVRILGQGHSFLAVDDGLIGVIICSMVTKGEHEEHEEGEVFPAKFLKLEQFFEDLKGDYGKFDMFSSLETDKVLDLFILSTRQSSRQRGVGSLLVKRALEHAAQEGVCGACTMGLSIYSQKIFTKLGFRPQVEIEYGSYTQEDQEIFDCKRMGEHNKGIFFTLNI